MPSATLSLDSRNRLRIRRGQILEGSWKLVSDRELLYAVRETQEDASRRTVSFRGSLVEAKAHALIFAVQQVDDQDAPRSQRISLTGRWQADAANRLTFLVERGKGEEDRLILGGGWDLGADHSLRYRLRRSAHDVRELQFDGAWDVLGARRIVYRLAGTTRSAFEFRAVLASPSIAARQGRLAYQVGVQMERGVLRRQRITLFGTWKLRGGRSVSFEVPYAEGRIRAIRFEGAVSPAPGNRLIVALSTPRHEPLGLTVTWTRGLGRDADLFVRMRREAGETSVVGGVEMRF